MTFVETPKLDLVQRVLMEALIEVRELNRKRDRLEQARRVRKLTEAERAVDGLIPSMAELHHKAQRIEKALASLEKETT